MHANKVHTAPNTSLPFAKLCIAAATLNTVQNKLKFFDVKIFIIKKGRRSSLEIADDNWSAYSDQSSLLWVSKVRLLNAHMFVSHSRSSHLF